MSTTDLVLFDKHRASVTGLELPSPPPTRINISGYTYKITPGPSIALPPILGVVKTIFNWFIAGAGVARTIGFLKAPSGFVTSDPTQLQLLANFLPASLMNSSMKTNIASTTVLQNCVVKDCGGTSAQATSAVGTIAGSASGTSLPPQVSVAISWQIAESYRGGKPRWYLTGIPQSAVLYTGWSQITPGYATAVAAGANAYQSAVQGPISGITGTFTLGTVSYRTGHAVRPTPLFRTFLEGRVHERLDSQRRRSGKEGAFPVTP